MPFLTLEYSTNIFEKNALFDFFAQCHAILAASLPTKIDNCKSRGLCSESYYIGDGQPHHGFVHLEVKILSGRSEDTLKKLNEQLNKLMETYFAESKKLLHMQLSLEIIERGNYFLKI